MPSVLWHAPFFSGGGYCSEATSFVLELANRVPLGIVQHGDGYNADYLAGLPAPTQERLQTLYSQAGRRVEHQGGSASLAPADSVAICHSEPGAWSPPGLPPSSWERAACPPPNALYSVGRTMFETDRLPDGWAPRLNALDEVWVPSQHSFETFAAGGVEASKLHVVGEPVDTDFFHPERSGEPFALPDAEGEAVTFRFLSIFKWEVKWWYFLDVLLSVSLIQKVSLHVFQGVPSDVPGAAGARD